MMDLGSVAMDLGKKNKKRNGDFGCGLLWVFDEFVGLRKWRLWDL